MLNQQNFFKKKKKIANNYKELNIRKTIEKWKNKNKIKITRKV